MKTELLHKGITEKIIRCFYNVYDELGAGFLESVYEKALIYELKKIGLSIESQIPIQAKYKEIICGHFIADIIVEKKIIIEIKAISSLLPIHDAQIINYLKATGIELGMLVNFGKKFEFRRRILTDN